MFWVKHIKINFTCFSVLFKNEASKRLNIKYVPCIIFLLVETAFDNGRDKLQKISTGFRRISGATAHPEHTALPATWGGQES